MRGGRVRGDGGGRYGGGFDVDTGGRNRVDELTARTGGELHLGCRGWTGERQAGLRRGFCAECGSSLFFEDLNGERISIAAGTLDRSDGLKIATHIFAAEAGGYYRIDAGVPVSADGSHAVPLP